MLDSQAHKIREMICFPYTVTVEANLNMIDQKHCFLTLVTSVNITKFGVTIKSAPYFCDFDSVGFVDGSNSFEKLIVQYERTRKIRKALLDSVCGKI